jgi:apolipoprotein D and lipocalin family protein
MRRLAVAISAMGVAAMSTLQASSPVRSIAAVNLTRYAGKWYEIARYPNSFQRQCAGDVTAEYTLEPSGRIRVVNRCRKADGTMDSAEGVAKRTPGAPDSQLKVRFAPAVFSFIPAVWGDYWIIGLAPDYSYAVVGDPSRKYLWILSRTPRLENAAYDTALEMVKSNGFDPNRLERTKQQQR